MKYFLKLSLSLCLSSAAASAASAPLSNTDFRFDSEGQVVNIDKNGAELYLYYQGDTRETGDKVNITTDDPNLKVTFGKACNIKTSPDTCKFVLRYANINLPSHGKKTIIVSDAGSQKVIEYYVWVKPSNDENEVHWQQKSGVAVNGPVIMQNGTHLTRTYEMHIQKRDIFNYIASEIFKPLSFNLPAKSLCYIDSKIYPPELSSRNLNFNLNYSWRNKGIFSFRPGDYMMDATNRFYRSYNGAYITGFNNISSCATDGWEECSRNWESWTVGLMNLSGETLRNGSEKIDSGEIKYQKNRSWNSNDIIYWTSKWETKRLALLTIQGTTDGSGFDPTMISPSLQQVLTAPPCSKYTNQPAPTQKILNVRTKGPGSIFDERGVVYDHSFQSYYVDNGILLELTAVPEEGRKFTGWSGVNCSNDSLYCAFNVDGTTDITANFE